MGLKLCFMTYSHTYYVNQSAAAGAGRHAPFKYFAMLCIPSPHHDTTSNAGFDSHYAALMVFKGLRHLSICKTDYRRRDDVIDHLTGAPHELASETSEVTGSGPRRKKPRAQFAPELAEAGIQDERSGCVVNIDHLCEFSPGRGHESSVTFASQLGLDTENHNGSTGDTVVTSHPNAQSVTERPLSASIRLQSDTWRNSVFNNPWRCFFYFT